MNSRRREVSFVEEMLASEGTREMDYRQFRQKILLACQKKGTPGWGFYDDAPTFYMLRQRVNAFREHVRYSAADWIRNKTYSAANIYRALRLDRDFTLELMGKDRRLRAWMRWRSSHTTLGLAYPWLRLAGTYEGRAFIFENCVPNPILASRAHYSREVDFGIMRWRRFTSAEELKIFSSLTMDWIRSANALGMRTPQSMIDWIPRPDAGKVGRMMWFLVRTGIILEPEEKAWITDWYRQRAYMQDSELDEVRLEQVIEILLSHDVPREQIAKTLCIIPSHGLEPPDIIKTMALLQSCGVGGYAVLLDGLEDRLFEAKPERWQFVLDTLGVRDPLIIAQFRPLLSTSRSCSTSLALALIRYGADAAQLVKCQELLCAAAEARIYHDPAVALAMLMSAPCSLSLDQVVEAENYLCRSGNLAAFLCVLAKHGFYDASAVLSFQPFFVQVDLQTLSRMIALAKPKATDVVAEVVDWISNCGTTGHIDAYEYLAPALKLQTVPQLKQVARVGFLGTGILRYLVEEQGLSSKNAMMAWFYERAFGIKSIRYGNAELDPVAKLLFEDAFNRRAFNHWQSNLGLVSVVARKRVEARLGPHPYRTPDEFQQRYRERSDLAYAAERLAMMPLLTRMLNATSGIILAGVEMAAWDSADSLDRQLEKLAPLLNELLAGRGPQGASITDIEADAVALVYRSSPHTVQQAWHNVIDREEDVQDWALAPGYQMMWRHASWSLKAPLDKIGLEAVGHATSLAMVFQSNWHDDADGALVQLRQGGPEFMDGQAESLPQLAVLLAIVKDDPIAAIWLQGVQASLEVEDERAYQYVLTMNAFFGIGLMDAVQAGLDVFCEEQSNRSASLLAGYLGTQPAGSDEPQVVLCAVLNQVAQRVRQKYSKWASDELAKFGEDGGKENASMLNAVVTKHPAAFFAKEAVKLCTAGNVTMWQEARQAHLLVFDLVHRSLQGMALIYREVLPALHPSRPTLVIRAINPTDDALAAYNVSSIVDAFFATAVEIARASDCVAVAFPANTGMHLQSNLDPIAHDISERYIRSGTTFETRDLRATKNRWLNPVAPFTVTFDAYERGSQPVAQLYLVWCDGLDFDRSR